MKAGKTTQKTIILLVSLALIVAAILYLQSLAPQRLSPESAEIQPPTISPSREAKAARYEPAKEIVNPSGYINTQNITLSELVGKKVILVDFWTYSCINCQRTFPYLKAWYEKYNGQGLEIIGVHTPEFEFEKDYNNVLAAVKKFNITYPVVLDNDYATWRAYQNRYWPHKYLIDIDGFIVYDHIGEGAYDETEKKIQELLRERMTALGIEAQLPEEMSKPSAAEASIARSPEIYFGAARNEYLGNGKRFSVGPQSLSEPPTVKTNVLYLVGDWNIQDEFAQNQNAPAKIIFRYQAKNVFLVASADEPLRLKILRDGKATGAEAGKDVINSSVTVKDPGLYRLIEDPSGVGEHTIEIIAEKPGLRAFTFTFG